MVLGGGYFVEESGLKGGSNGNRRVGKWEGLIGGFDGMGSVMIWRICNIIIRIYVDCVIRILLLVYGLN